MLVDEYISSFDDVSLFSLRNLRNIMTNGVDAATPTSAATATSRSRGTSDNKGGNAANAVSLEPAQVMACYRLLKAAAVPEDAEELANMADLLCPLPDTDQEPSSFDDEVRESEDESSDSEGSDSGEGAASRRTASNGRAKKKKTRQKTLRPVLDIKKHRAAFDGAWRAFVNLKGLPKGQ